MLVPAVGSAALSVRTCSQTTWSCRDSNHPIHLVKETADHPSYPAELQSSEGQLTLLYFTHSG